MGDTTLPSKAIETGNATLAHADMSDREADILEEIKEITGFIPEAVIWRSDYVGTGRVGAVHYMGKIAGKEVVLKIQGVKPEISEGLMVEQFSAQNRSRLIRPPLIYDYIPWNDDKGYEAFVMELVNGKKVVESGKILTMDEVAGFFEIYKEYRQHCIVRPWLPQPERTNLIEELKDRLFAIAREVKPESRLRKADDVKLTEKAIEILRNIYKEERLEFVHGHFSTEDLMYQGDQVVLFSNLFWKWKYPFYDLVFGYHWEILTLARVKGITPAQIEEQRAMWKAKMLETALTINQKRGEGLFKAALLERAAAGLMVDGHAYLPEEDEISKYLIEHLRVEVLELCDQLA